MEISSYIIWNAIITLVLGPILYSIRQNANEAKRLDILLNKTREEIAKEYVTKDELKDDMKNVMDRLEKLDEKLFVRIHRSTIVNIERVISIAALPKGGSLLELTSGTSLKVSRNYRESVRSFFQ